MGLDVSHDCWSGSYSAFARWRDALCVAAEWPMEEDATGRPFPTNIAWEDITDEHLVGKWKTLPEDPLILLIAHSDCDGSLPKELLLPLASRLEGLIPKIRELFKTPGTTKCFYEERTEKFIYGLRTAFAAGEDVEFS